MRRDAECQTGDREDGCELHIDIELDVSVLSCVVINEGCNCNCNVKLKKVTVYSRLFI
jgi:hypothetical protein